jgi:hypothetical protein
MTRANPSVKQADAIVTTVMVASKEEASSVTSSSKRPRFNASIQPPSVGIYFQKHTEATEELVKSIVAASALLPAVAADTVPNEASQSNSNDALRRLLEQAAIQFINLREAQRQASFLLEQKAEAVRQRRLQIEQGNLLLQNLIYERACMEREISACKDFHLKELSTMACEETKGVPSDPSALTTQQITDIIQAFLGSDINLPLPDRQLHQQRLDFMAQQISEREMLKQELEDALTKKAALENENESKRQFLSSLPTQLEHIEKSTFPLQKYFKLRNSEWKERLARAKQLSRPLYILCSQLVAYVEYAREGEGIEMSVEMMDAVQYDLPKPAKDDAGKVEEQRDTETQDVATTLVRDTLQADPLAVILKFRWTKGIEYSASITRPFEIDIRFQFIPKLNVVTAEASGNARLLINLFPGDAGESFPNMSTYHDESLIDDQIMSILFGTGHEFLGRPYLWAQRLAGILFLPGFSDHKERLEPSTKAIFRQLQRRIRAQAVLSDLLSVLSTRPNPIPVHPTMDSDWCLTRSPDSAALVYWSEVQQSSKLCHLLPLFGYEDNETQAIQGRWCRYFRAKLQRQTDHVLTIFVEVPPDYPAKPPRWLLQSPVSTQRHDDSDPLSAQIPQHDNNMKHIEMEVNTELSDLITDNEEESFDWILIHQLRKIMACWDALFDEGIDVENVEQKMALGGSLRCQTMEFDRYSKPDY